MLKDKYPSDSMAKDSVSLESKALRFVTYVMDSRRFHIAKIDCHEEESKVSALSHPLFSIVPLSCV